MICADVVAALFAWVCFFLIRKIFIEHQPIALADIFKDRNIVIGSFLVSSFWVTYSALFGEYYDLYKKSRLKTIKSTFLITLSGSIVLFFTLLLDDKIFSYTDYYKSLVALFLLYFFVFTVIRISIITLGKNQLLNGKVYFDTIFFGDGDRVNTLISYYKENKSQPGYRFQGYIGKENPNITIPYLGKWSERNTILKNVNYEECFVAFDHPKEKELLHAIHDLDEAEKVIKIIPENYQIIAGAVRMDNIYSELLIEIDNQIIKPWQWVAKRIMDIVLSLLAVFFLSPLLLFCILKIKRENHGPILYRQERVGYKGKTFVLLKFRSMYTDAENGTPRLAEDNDARITPWGGVMRKYRLDELPQIFNVLSGEMSWVGPRPERQYFIHKIIEKAPQYVFLHKIKPGITSWGMVRYGYASTVEEMIKRMQFDILYVENYSLTLDISILFQTFLTILRGEGK